MIASRLKEILKAGARRRAIVGLDGRALPSDHGGVRLDELAKRLSDRGRIGLSPELCDKLKLKPEEATRANLKAMEDDDQGFLGVYLLGAYVVEDTDVWGDGEIYWYSVPVHLDKKGPSELGSDLRAPTGAPPHKVGSLEWMQNFSLGDPPLLTLIPPDDEIAACVLRIAFYDDDGERANMPQAMTAGLTALANCFRRTLPGAAQIILPVREAIYKSLVLMTTTSSSIRISSSAAASARGSARGSSARK